MKMGRSRTRAYVLAFLAFSLRSGHLLPSTQCLSESRRWQLQAISLPPFHLLFSPSFHLPPFSLFPPPLLLSPAPLFSPLLFFTLIMSNPPAKRPKASDASATYCSGPRFKLLSKRVPRAEAERFVGFRDGWRWATDGPYYGGPRKTRALCPRDVLALIAALNDEFMADGLRFGLDAAFEGGVKVVDWPGKTVSMYKCLRFGFFGGSFPQLKITEGDGISAVGEFPTDTLDTPLIPPNGLTEISTFLKAFYGAPVWTRDEVTRVASTIVRVWNADVPGSVKLVKSSIPSTASLVSKDVYS